MVSPGDRVVRKTGPKSLLGTVLSVHLEGTCDRCTRAPHAIVKWDDGPHTLNGVVHEDFDEAPEDLEVVQSNLDTLLLAFHPGDTIPGEELRAAGYVYHDRWRGPTGCWVYSSEGAARARELLAKK